MSFTTKTRMVGLFVMLAVLATLSLAQTGMVRGVVTDAESRQPLAGATIVITGTRLGAAADAGGRYEITGVPLGSYTMRASFLGYTSIQRSVRVTQEGIVLDFALTQTTLQQREVIVEVNRARDRETPVAFTDITKDQIDQRIHGQDAPLLLKGTPGLYAFSTDGVGNGEAKLFVRGFNQNYVQVLINGVPTNDPESNSVYWSNWGSVSSAAASVQVQRGAGSSLYGAGSFGGSFNIVTGNARPRAAYGVNLSLGSPMNTMYGVDLNTGLIDDKFAVSLRLDRKLGEGSRLGARYEGYNYYLSGSWFINEQQSLKAVLHGAPQEHGYSFSNDISYFKYFGYTANSAPWLKRSVINGLPVNPNDGKPNYGLLDGRRELVTDDYSTLSHNHFHKPQVELHYNNDLTENSAIRATLFYSMGRGGGSSLNSSTFPATNRWATHLDSDGAILNAAVADTMYLRNAYQRDSYSLHQQGGLLASYEFKPMEDLKVTAGGEFRYWTADHPGHYTNLYGKTSITAQQYGAVDTAGAPTSTLKSFRRRTYQGDVSQENDVAIFGWDLANEPTYRSQYRNYRGETPQYTLFASANYNVLPNLIVTGTLQYVHYTYDLIENMPSENSIGKRLSAAQKAALGLTSSSADKEGKNANGKFYMAEYGTGANLNNIIGWYEFDLINASRSRGFIQPKFGANYNITENLNVFGNFAHVERFTDLSVYYNQGRLNPDAKDEISNQFEVGAGWTSRELTAKANLYQMTWDNKSQRIADASQAGQPGYDRNGNKTILVGTAEYKGIEIEASSQLDWLLPIKGFEVRGSATFSSNKWKSVLDEAKRDDLGRRFVFNSNAFNAFGGLDTVFVDELAGTHVGGPPQLMLSFGTTYRWDDLFVGIDANFYDNHYAVDGDAYHKVLGEWNATKTVFTPTYRQVLQSRMVIDAQAGYRYEMFGVKAQASLQILNLLDEKYWADQDNFGVIPGGLRAWRLNLSLFY
ncbi:MAG: TonB-dependent receptor [Bacteroidetes bacterium]|nr:TonB-dependent receptor [Bacteroidota bacterium]